MWAKLFPQATQVIAIEEKRIEMVIHLKAGIHIYVSVI